MKSIKVIATIFNVIMLLLLVLFGRKFTWQKDKACIIGFGFMELTYLLNTLCIWA